MEERKDPMALWVGSWTPEEIINRERPQRDPKHQPPQPQDDDTTSAS